MSSQNPSTSHSASQLYRGYILGCQTFTKELMKLTRRQFAQLAAATVALPWAVPAASPAPDEEHRPEFRWLARERRTVFEGHENCWHPQIVRARNGVLFLSFLLGDPPKTILLRSGDNGQTWSEPQLIHDRFQLDGGGGWGLAALSNGRLLMSYLDIAPWQRLPQWPPASEPRVMGLWPEKGLRTWAWHPESTELILRTLHSDDGGTKWTINAPIALAPWLGAIPHGSGSIFESGNTVYMPVWAWRSKGHFGNCGLLASSDGGVTWSPGPLIAQQDPRQRVEYRESTVQVLPTGEWIALCRANQPNYYESLNVSTHIVRSHDGRTWSNPRPAFVAMGFPRLTLLPDGGLLASGSYSEGLHFYISYDSGESWAFEDNLYSRDSRLGLERLDVGSPSIAALDDQRMVAVYYAATDKTPIMHKVLPATNRIEAVFLHRTKNSLANVLLS